MLSTYTILIILNTQLILANNSTELCNTGNKTYACHQVMSDNSKRIILGFNSPDMNFILAHELGHGLFYYDKKINELITKYSNLKKYCTNKHYSFNCISGYNTEKERLDEKIANYYGLYRTKNNEFKEKHPDLYKYFKNKEQEKYTKYIYNKIKLQSYVP